jgi:hypothetical protein
MTPPAGGETGVDAITVGADEPAESAPILSVVRADSDILPIEDGERAGLEAGASRKRKRRRRRGQRDRLGTEGAGQTEAGDEGQPGDASDGGELAGGDDSFDPVSRSSESPVERAHDPEGERERANRSAPAASPYRADAPSPAPDPVTPPPGPQSSEPSA